MTNTGILKEGMYLKHFWKLLNWVNMNKKYNIWAQFSCLSTAYLWIWVNFFFLHHHNFPQECVLITKDHEGYQLKKQVPDVPIVKIIRSINNLNWTIISKILLIWKSDFKRILWDHLTLFNGLRAEWI